LFLVTGASGVGKSAVALMMARRDNQCVHLESDILWRPEFNQPQTDYYDYRNLWLRMCMNIGQAGKPVVLYGSVTPGQCEPCTHRRYFSQLHYLALTCSPELLAERLRARPGWRAAGSDAFIEGMQRYNAWFIENAEYIDPPITLFDTSHVSLEETAAAVTRWVDERWEPQLVQKP
jgi:broad-specificity NMP kinase